MVAREWMQPKTRNVNCLRTFPQAADPASYGDNPGDEPECAAEQRQRGRNSHGEDGIDFGLLWMISRIQHLHGITHPVRGGLGALRIGKLPRGLAGIAKSHDWVIGLTDPVQADDFACRSLRLLIQKEELKRICAAEQTQRASDEDQSNAQEN
jgi:hypothetical protein